MNFLCTFIIVGFLGSLQYSMANAPQDADNYKSERSGHTKKSHTHSTSGSSDGSMSKPTRVRKNKKGDQAQINQDGTVGRSISQSEFHSSDNNYDEGNEMKSYKPQYSQETHHRHTSDSTYIDKDSKASTGTQSHHQTVKYNQHVAFDQGGHDRDRFHTHKTQTYHQQSESGDGDNDNATDENIKWRKSHESKHRHQHRSRDKSLESSDETNHKTLTLDNQKSSLYNGESRESRIGDQAKNIGRSISQEPPSGSKGQQSSYKWSGNGRSMDGGSFSQSFLNNQKNDNINSQSLKSFSSNYGMNGENSNGFPNDWLANLQQQQGQQFPFMRNTPADPFRAWNLNSNNMHPGPDQLSQMGMGIPNLPQMGMPNLPQMGMPNLPQIPMLPFPQPLSQPPLMNTDISSTLKQNNENWMKYINSMNSQPPGLANPNSLSNSFLQGNSGPTQTVQNHAQFPFISSMQQQDQLLKPLVVSEPRTTYMENEQSKTKDGNNSAAKLVKSSEKMESFAGSSSKSHIIQSESKDGQMETTNKEWNYKTNQGLQNQAESTVTDLHIKSHENTKTDKVSFTQTDRISQQKASLNTTKGSRDEGEEVAPNANFSNNVTRNSNHTQGNNHYSDSNNEANSKYGNSEAKKTALTCTTGLCKWEFRNKKGNVSALSNPRISKSFTSFLNFSEDHSKRTVNLQQHVCASESVKFSFYHVAPFFTVQVEGISATESPHVIIPTADDDYFSKIKIECVISSEIKRDDNDAGCLLLFTRHKNSTVMIKEGDKVEFSTSYNEGGIGGNNKAHLQVNHYHEEDSEEISGQKIRFRAKSNVVLEYAIPTEEDICTVLTCQFYAHKTPSPANIPGNLPSLPVPSDSYSEILSEPPSRGQLKSYPQDAITNQLPETRLTKNSGSEHNIELLNSINSYQILSQNQVPKFSQINSVDRKVTDDHNDHYPEGTPSPLQNIQLSHLSKIINSIENENLVSSSIITSKVDSGYKYTTKPFVSSTVPKDEIGEESNSANETTSLQFPTSKIPNAYLETQETTSIPDRDNVQYPQQTPSHFLPTTKFIKQTDSTTLNSKVLHKSFSNSTISSSNPTIKLEGLRPGFAPGLTNPSLAPPEDYDLFFSGKHVGGNKNNQGPYKKLKFKPEVKNPNSESPPLPDLPNDDNERSESEITFQPIFASFTTPALKVTGPTRNGPFKFESTSQLSIPKDSEEIQALKKFEIPKTSSVSIIAHDKLSTRFHSSRLNTCSNGSNLIGCYSSSESIISHANPETVTLKVSTFAVAALNFDRKTDTTTITPFPSNSLSASTPSKISHSIESENFIPSQIRPSNVDWNYKYTTKPFFIPSSTVKVKTTKEINSAEAPTNHEIHGHILDNYQNPNSQEQAKLADKDPFYAISILPNNGNNPQYLTSIQPNVYAQQTTLTPDNRILVSSTDTSNDKITQTNKIRPFGRGFDGNPDSGPVTPASPSIPEVATEIASTEIPSVRNLPPAFPPSSRRDILNTLENILNGNNKDDRQCSCRCPCFPKVIFQGIPIGIVEKIGNPVVDPRVRLKAGENLSMLMGRDKTVSKISANAPAAFEIFEDDEDSNEKPETHSKQTLSKHIYLNLTTLHNGTLSWVEAKVGDSLFPLNASSKTNLDFLSSEVMSMTLRKRKQVEKVELNFKVFNGSQMKKCSSANTNVGTHLFFGRKAQVYIELGDSALVTLSTNEDVVARAKTFSLGNSKVKMILHVGRAGFSTKNVESSNVMDEKTFYVTLSQSESPCKLVLKG